MDSKLKKELENTIAACAGNAALSSDSAKELAPGSVTCTLFGHMERAHDLRLNSAELSAIVRVVNGTLEERLRWWIENASGIARERGDLLRAGEVLKDALDPGHPAVAAWKAVRPSAQWLHSFKLPEVKDTIHYEKP